MIVLNDIDYHAFYYVIIEQMIVFSGSKQIIDFFVAKYQPCHEKICFRISNWHEQLQRTMKSRY